MESPGKHSTVWIGLQRVAAQLRMAARTLEAVGPGTSPVVLETVLVAVDGVLVGTGGLFSDLCWELQVLLPREGEAASGERLPAPSPQTTEA